MKKLILSILLLASISGTLSAMSNVQVAKKIEETKQLIKQFQENPAVGNEINANIVFLRKNKQARAALELENLLANEAIGYAGTKIRSRGEEVAKLREELERLENDSNIKLAQALTNAAIGDEKCKQELDKITEDVKRVAAAKKEKIKKLTEALTAAEDVSVKVTAQLKGDLQAATNEIEALQKELLVLKKQHYTQGLQIDTELKSAQAQIIKLIGELKSAKSDNKEEYYKQAFYDLYELTSPWKQMDGVIAADAKRFNDLFARIQAGN